MTFQYHVDDADNIVPVRCRGTKKMRWNAQSHAWDEYTIWTVDHTRELRAWLDECYPNKEGWGTAWNESKIIMEERVYIHYALKFE